MEDKIRNTCQELSSLSKRSPSLRCKNTDKLRIRKEVVDLAGVLYQAHPGSIRSHVQCVDDVDHEFAHGLKLVGSHTARAVNNEHQVHWARLALLLRSWFRRSENV